MTEIIKAFHRLWPYLRPYKARLFGIFIMGAIMAAATSVQPKLIEMLLQDVFAEKNEDVAAWLPFAFPVLFLISGVARYFNSVWLNLLAERVVSQIRQNVVSKFTRLNLTFHNSFESGSGGLISRVLNDTYVLQIGLAFFGDFFREPLRALGLLAYMFYIDWKLTVALLLFLPFFAMATKRVSRSLRKYGHMNREAMEGVTATIKESLDGVRVIQSFNLEKELDRRFSGNIEHYMSTRKKIITREEAIGPINEFAASLLVMGVVIYMIQEIFYHQANAATFISFIMAAGYIQVPIKRLQETTARISQTIVVSERLFEILENRSEVPEIVSPVPWRNDWKKIVFRNVSFTYGNNMVLKNVNLTVNRGEVIALVGESGSGKSTLVNMLERFFDPTSGEVLIDDTPITHFKLEDLRAHIALVTQDVFLFRDSIARNIQSGDFTKDISGVQRAAQLANADKFITATKNGYENQVGERGGFLSGGEKQRVSIARAIFKDAPILILDEATSALDSVSEMEVQKGLNHLMEGRTAFVIAHRLSTVFNASRILVMKNGELVEQGSHQELLAREGEYYNFFRLQMDHGNRA